METTTHIEQLKQKLLGLGPILPGSISEQWNVCGTPGCKCKDTANPKKTRPILSAQFQYWGRSSSMFIKKEDVVKVRNRVKRYQVFKKLTMDWSRHMWI